MGEHDVNSLLDDASTREQQHALLEDLADATLDGTRKRYLTDLTTVPLLIIDDLGCASCRTRRPRTCSRS